MNPPISRSKKTTGGFTLVEILVSMAVLGLMMVGVAQMMNSALNATLGGYKHMDADTQARMVLDRMAYDISKITKRSDVDYYFQKNSTSGGSAAFYGNDQMAFYSESGGYYPSAVTTPSVQDSNTSLVGYMIAPMLNGVYTAVASGGTPQLVRLSKGLTWNGALTSAPAMVFNPVANPYSSTPNTTLITSNTITSNWPQVATGQDPNYQPFGDQVFRLEYSFLVQTPPGTSSPTITASGFSDYPSYYSASTYTSDTTPNALKDVTAIVVSIAVLDTKSRAGVSNSALQTAAAALSDDNFTTSASSGTPSTVETQLPLYLWKSNLNTAISNGTYLGLPKAAASQVRFYQRICYLNHLQ